MRLQLANWVPVRDVLRIGAAIAVALLLPRRFWGQPREILMALLVGIALGLATYIILSTRNRAASAAWPERRWRPRFVALLLAHAAYEELVWRGLAFQVLGQYVPLPAAFLVSAGGFAGLHYESQGLKGVAVHLLTGTAFAGVVLLTGSIIAAIAAHATYNLFAIASRTSTDAAARTAREALP